MDSINCESSLVIVEGKNDEKALREFGLRAPVYRFRSTGLSETLFIDEVAGNFRGSSVVVLLDFDDEGTRMAARMSRELEERGVKIKHHFRRELREILVREGVRHIEEIQAIKHKTVS